MTLHRLGPISLGIGSMLVGFALIILECNEPSTSLGVVSLGLLISLLGALMGGLAFLTKYKRDRLSALGEAAFAGLFLVAAGLTLAIWEFNQPTMSILLFRVALSAAALGSCFLGGAGWLWSRR